jgi:hypothetical protein
MMPDDGLVDELFREQVRRARAMSPEEKVLAGPRLFERSCRIMADGIRDRHPQATEEEVQQILTTQLALLRRLERGE